MPSWISEQITFHRTSTIQFGFGALIFVVLVGELELYLRQAEVIHWGWRAAQGVCALAGAAFAYGSIRCYKQAQYLSDLQYLRRPFRSSRRLH